METRIVKNGPMASSVSLTGDGLTTEEYAVDFLFWTSAS